MHLSFKLHKNIVFHKSITHIKSLKAQNHSFPYTWSSPHHSQYRLSYHTVQLTYLPFYLFERPVLFWGWHMHISVMPPQTTHSVMLLSCYSWAFFLQNMQVLYMFNYICSRDLGHILNVFLINPHAVLGLENLKPLLIAHMHTLHWNIWLIFVT